MSLKFKIAKSPADLDRVFRLRHKILVEEENVFPPSPDGRLVDRFDAFPTSTSLLAEFQGTPIGTLRLTIGAECGLTSDDIFDYKPCLPVGELRVVSETMLCLDPAFRKNPKLLSGLFLLGYYWSVKNGVSHVLAPFPTDVAKHVMGLGCKLAAPECHARSTHQLILPLILVVDECKDFFIEYVRRQEIHEYLESFERESFAPGEVIIRQGDMGEAAYVVVDGVVTVSVGTHGTAQEKVVCELGPGEMIGEISLLTAVPRTANVVAFTDVDVMVLERQAFHESVMRNPESCLAMLKALGRRLKDTTKKTGEL